MSKSKAKGFKKLDCKICGETVEKVDEKADRVTCSSCVQRSLQGITCLDQSTINPNKTEEQ
jgi:hypothetical protein